MMLVALSLSLLGQVPGQVSASQMPGESPRTFVLELKLGPYTPRIDYDTDFKLLDPNEARPYAKVFGGTPMLMGELGLEYLVWQKFGTIGAGVTVSYAEKFGKALINETTGQLASESTGLRLLPIKPTVSYRFDLLAFKYKVPLVPYHAVVVDQGKHARLRRWAPWARRVLRGRGHGGHVLHDGHPRPTVGA